MRSNPTKDNSLPLNLVGNSIGESDAGFPHIFHAMHFLDA